jgi:hypothetical protein
MKPARKNRFMLPDNFETDTIFRGGSSRAPGWFEAICGSVL